MLEGASLCPLLRSRLWRQEFTPRDVLLKLRLNASTPPSLLALLPKAVVLCSIDALLFEPITTLLEDLQKLRLDAGSSSLSLVVVQSSIEALLIEPARDKELSCVSLRE